MTEMPCMFLNPSVATKDHINIKISSFGQGNIISPIIFPRHYFPETEMQGLLFLPVAVMSICHLLVDFDMWHVDMIMFMYWSKLR